MIVRPERDWPKRLSSQVQWLNSWGLRSSSDAAGTELSAGSPFGSFEGAGCDWLMELFMKLSLDSVLGSVLGSGMGSGMDLAWDWSTS